MFFRGYYIEPFLQGIIADNLLNEIFAITKKLGIKTFLALGTCLGFVRDGGYIKGDLDIDLGVICKWEEKDIITKAFEINGISLTRNKRGDKHVHYRKNNIGIDVWFRTGTEKFYSKFDHVTYLGKKYPVPHPVEEYLRTCYTNWKVKEKETTRYRG